MLLLSLLAVSWPVNFKTHWITDNRRRKLRLTHQGFIDGNDVYCSSAKLTIRDHTLSFVSHDCYLNAVLCQSACCGAVQLA